MLEPLVAYVSGQSEELIPALQLEELACAAAWADSHPREAVPEPAARIEDVIRQWTTSAVVRDATTEGRHQQPLLRKLIDALIQDGTDRLAEDEVCFLAAAARLAEAVQPRGILQRPWELLAPYREELQTRREATPPPPGLPDLARHVRFTTAEEIAAARNREIKSFAGIAMPCVAPTFSHTGDLKILGNVPERCVVVVDRGSCHVGGYLLGRVAATRDVEVLENVSGVAVVRQGSVRARNFIDGAFVVSKVASVYCRRSQGPRLVFAGNRIVVNGDVVMGRYVAPSIRIQGKVHGGEFAVTRSLEASWFREEGNRPVSIRFRRELSPQDYGELVSPEAQKLLARAVSVRYRMRQLQRFASLATEEAHEAAHSAVMFLCLGEEARERLQELQAKQRRLSYLRRMIAALQAVNGRTGVAEEDQALFDSAREGLQEMKDADSDNADLFHAQADVLNLWKELLEKERETGLTSQLLDRMRVCLSDWQREERSLSEEIDYRSREIRRLTEEMENLSRLGAKQTPVQLLRRLITTIATRGANSAVVSRLESPYLRLMLRIVRQRLDRARSHDRNLEEEREQLVAIAETLQTEYQMNIPIDGAAFEADARVAGRFDPGVRISAEALGSDSTAEGPCVLTEDSGGRSTAYVQRDGRILEVEEAMELPVPA